MSNWTDSKAIKAKLLQQWNSGLFLRHCVQEEALFPLRIKLTGPTSQEVGTQFAQMVTWIETLRQSDKNALGYGYSLIEKEIHHRVCGKNTIPVYAEISTLDDALRLIDKRKDWQLFCEITQMLLHEWDNLRDWIVAKPFQIFDVAQNRDKVLAVLRWFCEHEDRHLYLRQLDIEGVDTKFIEQHKSLLAQMLDILLPQGQIDETTKNFENRYGLKSKPALVRFRLLDSKIQAGGYTDFHVPFAEFKQVNLPVSRCFFTENEINFLSFPAVPKSCVIFGKGYGVELLRNVAWLGEKEIYYWGDIDTHGFRILSMARNFLPQTQSFLMTEEILLSHRALWSKEETPFLAPIDGLTMEEYTLACKLQANHWQKGVRMEQERIRFSEVEAFLAELK